MYPFKLQPFPGFFRTLCLKLQRKYMHLSSWTSIPTCISKQFHQLYVSGITITSRARTQQQLPFFVNNLHITIFV